MIHKSSSLAVSGRVFDQVDGFLEEFLVSEERNKISCYMQPFNNCRETGYCVEVSPSGVAGYDMPTKYFWVCQCRNSDDVMVCEGDDGDVDNHRMFSENVYQNHRIYFRYDEEFKAAKHIFDRIYEIYNFKS